MKDDASGQLPPPQDWRSNRLSDFLNQSRNNQFVTFAKLRTEYTLLSEIDDAFLKVGENLINPRNPLTANMFYRSHSAYRSGCGTSMAGQVPETFVLLRSCLEYAAHGLYIFKNPELGITWLDRHQDAVAMRAMKKAFMAINVQAVVASVDVRLGEVYQTLYDRAIDFGGHPNVMGVAGNMAMDEQTDRIMIKHLYLHEVDDALLMTLKSVAQVGTTSLHIFQHAFQERFMLLGVREMLILLRTKNL